MPSQKRAAVRVFLGPIEIAGVFRGLEAGLREIGVNAQAYDTSGDPLRYRGGRHRQIRVPGWLSTTMGQVSRARHWVARIVVFVRALPRHDIFIIGGTGFWSGLELPVLRLLGKRTVWVFLGSDHRPPYLNGKVVRRGMDAASVRRESARVARRVARVERWADEVIAHEASAQFHVRPFIRLLEIGLPLHLDAPPPAAGRAQRRDQGPVVVIHCPTDPVAKGSAEIRAMVQRMIADGLSVRYEEIIGRPHADVLAAVARADLVIDELYGDTPLGVLSAEASWFGTASICGGYPSATWRPLSEPPQPPALMVDPESFEERLRELVQDRDARETLGSSARSFVRDRWALTSVAQRLRQVIDGATSPAWRLDPNDVSYLDGYGMSRSARLIGIRTLIDAEGLSALCLAHRPDLLQALVADASSS